MSHAATTGRFDDLFGDTDRARRRLRRLRLVDRTIATSITCGGVLIILAVFGIFFFIALEAAPLFFAATTQTEPAVAPPAGGGAAPVLALGEDEYRERGFALLASGAVRLLDFTGAGAVAEVPLAGFGDAGATFGARAADADVVALATADGRVFCAGVRFTPVFADGRRTGQDAGVDWQMALVLREDGGRLDQVAVASDGERVTVAAAAPGFLGVATRSTGGTRVRLGDASAALGGRAVTALALDAAAENLVVGTAAGEVLHFELAREEATLVEVLRAGAAPVTALGFAFGAKTLLVGDAAGHVSGWQGVRSSPASARTLSRSRELPPLPGAVAAFAPSRRNKSFLVADHLGNVRLDHTTTNRTIATLASGAAARDVAHGGVVSLAPRGDGILAAGRDGALMRAAIDAPHPDASLAALFLPVLYEDYDQPELVWQSTGGSDDHEPKYSVVPLLVGSLKGVLYAMLISAPLAILAALYVSQFASHRVRGLVKPLVEIMGALPSVVVGFLAGLWLSPLIDQNLLATFNLFLFIPLGLAAAVLCHRALGAHRRRQVLGREVPFVLPFLAALSVAAVFAAGPLERLLFAGDLRAFLVSDLGLAYDRQNAFMVGIALGFAVMPILFTVTEDALSNIPLSLRAASDALGASRWQTAWRLVLPAASPGIFAALMLAFGRAVGETMIVVMATGNTPILDLSPFNGMRTISACVATEIPEAPVDSSLYRVLFLAGGILFVLTFLTNTAAELVGARLRKRFARW